MTRPVPRPVPPLVPPRVPASTPPRLRALRPAPKSAPTLTSRTGARPDAERLFLALGAEPAFAEAVLGDLAEEYALRAAHDGPGPARRWYAREALRSAPDVVRSAARHARGRARLAAAVAAVVLAVAAVVLALSAGVGPPARLVAGTRDTVVINTVRPVPLPTRVFDAAGRALPDTGVRYTRLAGAPGAVSARGVVTCTRPGDAIVRAALGALATTVVLHCRPVREVRVGGWTDFVVGDTARALVVEFVGVDGRPVTRVAAWVSVEDSTVATFDGLRVRPLAPGFTSVNVRAGDREAGAWVRVFAPVPTFAGLRPDQQLVATPVRLARGGVVRWPLPRGLFFLDFLPSPSVQGATSQDAPGAAPQAAPAQEAPALAVDGPVLCMPALRPGVTSTHCLARAEGASVTVSHPGGPRAEVVGALALTRQE